MYEPLVIDFICLWMIGVNAGVLARFKFKLKQFLFLQARIGAYYLADTKTKLRLLVDMCVWIGLPWLIGFHTAATVAAGFIAFGILARVGTYCFLWLRYGPPR